MNNTTSNVNVNIDARLADYKKMSKSNCLTNVVERNNKSHNVLVGRNMRRLRDNQTDKV